MGGEVVTVVGADLNRRAVLAIRAVPDVLKVTWVGSDSLKVIVEDAGTAVPLILDALRTAEIEVEEVREEHASFDDVFVQLMDAQAGAQPVGVGRAQGDR